MGKGALSPSQPIIDVHHQNMQKLEPWDPFHFQIQIIQPTLTKDQ